nr:AsmA family protein [Stutzerimonas stutzeri]
MAGLAGILVLLGGLALLAESPWARQLIERQLSQRLDGRAVSIGEFDIEWGLPLGVQLRDLRIANADWASDAPLLTLDALRARLGVGALLTGDVQLRSLQLVQPQVHLARQADGQTNWAALLGDGPEQGSLPLSPDPLRIRDGEIHYRDAQLDLQLDLSVATPPSDEGPRQLNVEGSGQFRGRPVSLTLIGDPPARALAADAPYTLSLNAQLGALQLRFEGQSASLPSLEQLQGRLTASASDAMAFDALPIDLPPFRLQANTRRDGSQWALSDIDLRTNGSHLTGAASVQAGSEPRVAIRLEGDQLDLDRWGLMPRPTRTGERRPMAADRLLGNARDLLERLGDYRGELSLQLDTLSYADNALQDVTIEAQLDGHHLELAQLHVEQGQGAVSLQGGFDWSDAGLSGALDAQLDQFDLGQALAAFGQPGLGVLDGEIHLRLAPDTASIKNTQLLYKAPQQDLRAAQRRVDRCGAGVARHGLAPPGPGTVRAAAGRATPTLSRIHLAGRKRAPLGRRAPHARRPCNRPAAAGRRRTAGVARRPAAGPSRHLDRPRPARTGRLPTQRRVALGRSAAAASRA